MRLSSVVVITSFGLLTIGVLSYFVARKYGISLELTRNASSHAKEREMRANELLQRLAAYPKLTIRTQAQDSSKQGKGHLVLAVVSRHVLGLIADVDRTEHPRPYPLLERLEEVDVESITYQSEEVPALILELRAVRSRHQNSPLNEDMTTLIQSLQQGANEGSEVVFY